MSYLPSRPRSRYQGVGAIATMMTAPPAPAPMKLMLAVPAPMTIGSPVTISPGVKVVRMAPTPPNVIVRVPVGMMPIPAPGIETLREAKLFAGTPASSQQPAGSDLQIGTGIGTPIVQPPPPPPRVAQVQTLYVAPPPIPQYVAPPAPPAPPPQYVPPPPPRVAQVPTLYGGSVSSPVAPIAPVEPYAAMPTAPSSSSSKLPWLIVGGGLLAYLLLKD